MRAGQAMDASFGSEVPDEPTGTVIGGWQRGFGLVLEILARDFTYGIMSYLADGARSAIDITEHFQRVHARLKDLIGDRPVSHNLVYPQLRALVRERLLVSTVRRDTFPPTSLYRLTEMGTTLLEAMKALGGFGERRYDYLVERIRVRDHIDPRSPSPTEEAGVPPDVVAVRRRRRSIGMALGLFHNRRFCYGMLTSISEGRRTTADWLERERAAIALNTVTTGVRSMNETQFYRNLRWLVDCRMVDTKTIRTARGRKETWAWATPLGYEYLEAVRPIGEAALEFSEELVEIIRNRRRMGE